MRSLRILCLVALALVGTMSAVAIPFDNTAGGPVTATVASPGGDYATLNAAATAFSGVVGGINRAWTLQIGTNTIETANAYFGNAFGAGASLTIRPAPATTPLVRWTNTGTVPGVYGHLVIGAKNNLAPNTNAGVHQPSNNNYIIDGSNTIGGTTRDLTLQIGNPGAGLASAMNNILTIYGNNDGVIVRNVNINMWDTSGVTSCGRNAGGLASGEGAVVPDNTLIQNCRLFDGYQYAGSVNAYGWQTIVNASGSVPAGTAAQNFQMIDNDIYCRQRGLFGNGHGAFTLRGNTLNMVGISGGYQYNGLWHLGSNSARGWVAEVSGNFISMEVPYPTSASQGAAGINLSGSDGVVDIFNNAVEIHYFGTPPGTPNDSMAAGIRCADASSEYTIEHNSVSIVGGAALTGATAQIGAVVVTARNSAGAADLRNNLLRSAQTSTNATGEAVIRFADLVNVTSNGNNLAAAGPAVARAGTTAYASLANWQTTGNDANGQSVDPTTTSPGVWDATLHFAARPNPMTGTTVAATIAGANVDIDGNSRVLVPPQYPYPGADEVPGFSLPAELSVFSTD